MDKNSIGFSSICAKDFPQDHQGENSHTLPLYATSTFLYGSAERAMAVFEGKEQAFIYSRWSNPTVEAVEQKLAALEAKETGKEGYALLFASGMAAISAVLFSELKPGEKILTHGNIYGAVTELLNTVLADSGIEAVFTDLHQLDQIEKLLAEDQSIRLLYVESPNNPTIGLYDLEAIGKLASAHSLRTVVDNTLATPYLQQPFMFGIDYVVHSGTKYLNGHGTGLSGVVCTTDKSLRDKIWHMRKVSGGIASPFEAWVLNNGLKTLSLRMERHSANAIEVAAYLDKHPAVANVHHPSLEHYPYKGIFHRHMRLPGGMLSFELKGGLEAGKKFMNNVQFCSLTATIGTTDTLVQHPASMTHAKVPEQQRLEGGITNGMIRMSVGIEDVEDIINDLGQALEKSAI